MHSVCWTRRKFGALPCCPPHVTQVRSTVFSMRFDCKTPLPATWCGARASPWTRCRSHRGAGKWTLAWSHEDEERIQAFKGWSLLLFGPQIAQIAGQVEVVGASGARVPEAFADVELDVVGLPASLGERLVRFDRTTGKFEIGFLPGMRLDVLASKPGFAQVGISGLNDPDHPRGFRDHLEGFLAGGPGSNALNVILTPAEGRPTVRSSVTHAIGVPSARGTVEVDGVRLSVYGGGTALAPGKWEVSWEGGSALVPGTEHPRGRSVSVDLQFPIDAFTPDNNWSLSVRPRVSVSHGGTRTYAQLPLPLTVRLAQPPESSPYRLIQAGPLRGFGGQVAYVGGVGATEGLELHAQKTTMTKVDLDSCASG